jgi:hypothetical protein
MATLVGCRAQKGESHRRQARSRCQRENTASGKRSTEAAILPATVTLLRVRIRRAAGENLSK